MPLLYVKENKKQDALLRDGEIQSKISDNKDATDLERMSFRYCLSAIEIYLTYKSVQRYESTIERALSQHRSLRNTIWQ
jgi:hypothetical protein